MLEDDPVDLKEKIARFPATPGVYLMKDAKSRILYIGKAVNLRSRVRSYFGKSSDTRILTNFLVPKIANVDCILTESEAEALILENNLIKKHRPLYNVRLKDDKTYVSIQVTLSERWPRMKVVRRYKKDGNLYFGPYGSAGAVRDLLRVVEKVFTLRNCTNGFFRGRSRPCIEHEMGRCTAPCVDLISHEEYMEDVAQVVLFLRGKSRELEKLLEQKMKTSAEARQFELAARYRDQVLAIKKVFETQKAQEFHHGDIDVFCFAREGDTAGVQEVVIREGKIINSQFHSFRTALSPAEVLSSFVTQYYMNDRFVPSDILVSDDFPDRELLEEWLREKKGSKVKLIEPQRGDKAALLELARKNAFNSFRVSRSQEERLEAVHESLRIALDLEEAPRAIECYDISTFQGALAVGALVAFDNGEPAKDRYRKYRIQTVVGADDFESMREVLTRRIRHGLEANDFPDLIVIDGGKGQLGVVVEVLAEYGVSHIPVLGLAKERRRKGTFERIFVPGKREPLPIPQDSAESLYLQRIRDETHRFAITYHRSLRRKHTLRTGLEDIPGIGKKKCQALIDRFATLKKIRESKVEEIAEVVGDKLAKVVWESLCEDEKSRNDALEVTDSESSTDS